MGLVQENFNNKKIKQNFLLNEKVSGPIMHNFI